MRILRRFLGWAVVAAIVAAIIYGFLPKPVLVETARVTRGPLMVTLEEEGKTRVRDRFAISAPVAGYAHRLQFKVGDAVRRGQVVLTMEPLPSSVLDPRSQAETTARVSAAEATQRRAEEAERAAEVDLDYWESELSRTRQLHEDGIVAREQLDRVEAEARRAQSNHRSAQFVVEVARHELEAARATLGSYARAGNPASGRAVTVTSPVGGRVLNVLQESEGVLNAGQTVLEIGDPRALEVEIEVLSSDAVRLGPGTKVFFERWGGDQPLEGRVRLVEPVGFTKISALGVEEQRVRVIADFVSVPEQWERLADGYRVEAKFVLSENEDILQAPSSALFRYDERWAVFVVSGGRVRRRLVDVGRQGGLYTEIVGGMQQGETVIIHPEGTLEDGARVQTRE